MMVVEPKMAQPIEPDEESINQFSSTSRRVQKLSLSSRTLVQLIEVWSRGYRGPTITCQVLNTND